MDLLNRFRNREKGQGLVEYGLILALISVVAVGALGGVGDKVLDTFSAVNDADSDVKIMDGYIPVSSAEDLDNIRREGEYTYGEGTKWENTYESGLDKKYIQVSDIDLADVDNFSPINMFTGEFDGFNYTISNLSIDLPHARYVGLFGRVNNGTIKNVNLLNVDIVGDNNVGGLVGSMRNSVVYHSNTSGKVVGGHDSGGLVGDSLTNSLISKSQSSVDFYSSKNQNTGGLLGRNSADSIVDQSFATGDVSGVDDVGGLVGQNDGGSIIRNSYSTGKVEGSGHHVGGLVGYNYDATTVISNSYAVGNVTHPSKYVGGLVGRQRGQPLTSDSYYDMNTTGQNDSDKGIGKSTDEMKDQSTYEGWNFGSVWEIKEGQYPTLKW